MAHVCHLIHFSYVFLFRFHFLVQTLLAFVNFRLYHSINVKYPPILDSRLEALAAGIVYSIHLERNFLVLTLRTSM